MSGPVVDQMIVAVSAMMKPREELDVFCMGLLKKVTVTLEVTVTW
jgi:hypothetical protein